MVDDNRTDKAVSVGGARGQELIVADADWLASAWLVAVIVTVCCEFVVVGAVYRPAASIVPTPLGLIVQLAAVSLVLFTTEVNCCVCPAYRVTLSGATLIATGRAAGINVTVDDADWDVSATLVAVMYTV